MSVYDYDFKIEGLMAQYGGEVDKNITRTCGNCCFYDNAIFVCDKSEDIEGQGTIEATTPGCWNHMTNAEQERLKAIVEEDNKQAARRRIAENRQNGTGQCAGCPFREMRDMLGKIYDIINRGIKLVIAIRVKKGCTPATARLLAYSNIEIARKIKALLKETR